MTRITVLVTAAFAAEVAASLADVADVHLVPPSTAGVSLADRGLDDELARADVIVAELDRVDEATLLRARRLGLVVACRAAPVNIDIDACTERGIAVATTPGRNAEVTADLTFALLLATVRKVSAAERWLRSSAWTSRDVFEPYTRFRSIGLKGRVLSVLGGGAVGRRVVERARGFGMVIKVYDPFLPENAFGDAATMVSLEEAMSTGDIVTVHVPLMPSTEGLIGRAELGLMKPEAYLINAGRAAIVDEGALMQTLRERRIAGAGFDVFYREPLPRDSELFTLDNVTMTPHIAGASDDVIVEHSRIAAAAIRNWATGDPVAAVANAARLGAVSS